MNDVDNHHSSKMANHHGFTPIYAVQVLLLYRLLLECIVLN